jgi:hypothetical protein
LKSSGAEQIPQPRPQNNIFCGVCSVPRGFSLQTANRKDQNLQENEHSNLNM